MNFFCKLVPPRVSFSQDMTPDEAGLMQRHAVYWQEWIGKGHVVVFGFVADPRGGFGMGVVEFPSEADARAFTEQDPVILSQQGFSYEISLMPLGATGR